MENQNEKEVNKEMAAVHVVVHGDSCQYYGFRSFVIGVVIVMV